MRSPLVFMAISAAATALSAYVLGDVINQAYTNRNMQRRDLAQRRDHGRCSWCVALRPMAHSVVLTRIAVRIVANNQRRMYDKLLNEGLAFFANRHSSEFIARLTIGASVSGDDDQYHDFRDRPRSPRR